MKVRVVSEDNIIISNMMMMMMISRELSDGKFSVVISSAAFFGFMPSPSPSWLSP